MTAAEETIYATSLLLIAMPPSRVLPRFDHVVPLEVDDKEVEVDIVL